MNQRKSGGIFPGIGGHTSFSTPGIQRGRGLRVLIGSTGDSWDHFSQILAANIQQWGYEAQIVSTCAPPGKGAQREVEGDILLCDLDSSFSLSSFIAGGVSTPVSLTSQLLANFEEWLTRVRLMIALSSRSVARMTLEQIGAVALLRKPFDMGRLQRYLRVLEQVLFDDVKPERQPQGQEGGGCGQVRVLVVDDHVEVAETIQQCLETEPGYEVRMAFDGLEALEHFVAWQPDCIVTDLLMPWMNGYQVMRCLAAGAAHRAPAFVVLSALNRHELPVNRAYLDGKSVVFVDKPFHIEHLLAAVEKALDQG